MDSTESIARIDVIIEALSYIEEHDGETADATQLKRIHTHMILYVKQSAVSRMTKTSMTSS